MIQIHENEVRSIADREMILVRLIDFDRMQRQLLMCN